MTCQFCWQLATSDYVCTNSTNCMTVSCPRQRYNATCTVRDHIHCLGKVGKTTFHWRIFHIFSNGWIQRLFTSFCSNILHLDQSTEILYCYISFFSIIATSNCKHWLIILSHQRKWFLIFVSFYELNLLEPASDLRIRPLIKAISNVSVGELKKLCWFHLTRLNFPSVCSPTFLIRDQDWWNREL